MSALRLPVLLLALLLAALPTSVLAQEVIQSYDSDIVVNADGSLEVSERIVVRAEGDRIRRGIYRDFPTRYRDRYGNRVAVGFEVLEVLRDGRPEPWFTEKKRNGIRLNTGDDSFLPVPATVSYTLRYRTTRQIGFFDDHDELYWNAIGAGWDFAKLAGTVRVQLPQPVSTTQLRAEGYSGRQGERGDGFVASTPAAGIGEWRLTQPLQGNEALTIAFSFPKGLVTPPGRRKQVQWLLYDNASVLAGFAGLLLLLAWCLWRWHRVGRDPAAGTVIVRYEPPPGISPAGLRHILRMGYDARCFSADVLSLAVGGTLKIERDKALLTDNWTLERTGAEAPSGTPGEQRKLLDLLFKETPRLDLKAANATTLQAAMLAHTKALDARFKGRMFNNHGGSALIALLMALLFSGAAIGIAVYTTAGMLLTLVPVALMLATAITFAFLVRAPTAEGRAMLDQIEGLRRYLGVAERQDLQRLPGPDAAEPLLDAQRFEALLPYAVALDVEEAWTGKFTAAVGAAAAAAATSGLAWYHGHGRAIGDLGGFTRSIGSQLASQISSSSTPPGSSSGAGGGGFAGGGGGGGGGGGR